MKRCLILFLIVLCLLFPCQVQATTNKTKSLLILGDSIAAHYGVEKEASYEKKLVSLLSQNGEKWDSINWGVNGATSSDLVTQLSRYEADEKTRDVLKNADYICISIGGNNLLAYLRAHGFNEYILNGKTNWSDLKKAFETDTPELLTDLKSDITAIMHAIRRLNPDAVVTFQTIHNVARDSRGSLAFMGKPMTFAQMIDPFFAPVREMFLSLADPLGYVVTDTYTAFQNSPEKTLLRKEMIHPNETGHTLIASLLYDTYLKKQQN